MFWCFLWIILMRWLAGIIVWLTIIALLVLLAAGRVISKIEAIKVLYHNEYFRVQKNLDSLRMAKIIHCKSLLM